MDLISIIPLEFVFNQFRFSKLVRLTRMSKLYRLLKLLKLLRTLRTLKKLKKTAKSKTVISKDGGGIERLVFLIMMFCVMYHIIACLW